MGAPAARITAADFVIPPEFRQPHPPARPLTAEAARVGGLRLRLELEGGRTRLVGCYQQVPLRLLPPFALGPGQPALLYLLNPTAGLMDGDGQLVEIDVGAGCRAVVVGQSATRIHPSRQGHCTQQWRIRVAGDAVLVVLPGPAIPFAGARYYQRAEIELADRANLIWGDIWYAGRYARAECSEQFQFDTLIQEFVVCRSARPVYRDRFCWQGPWDPAAAGWHFGGGPACASLFIGGPVASPLDGRPESCLTASFRTAAGDTVMRSQGTSEDVTALVVRIALQAAAERAGQAFSCPWLLECLDLAPNHWFSLATVDIGPRLGAGKN